MNFLKGKSSEEAKMRIIYCYTNKINNKKYVGQTNNPERRQREHKSNAFNEKSVNYGSVFHKALRKYGWENFNYEILEEVNGDANDREKYWIKEKQSLVSENGYNILEGGLQNFWNSRFTAEEIAVLKEKIKEGTKYDTLIEEYNVSKTFLSSINHGTLFFNKETIYPLFNYNSTEDTINALIEHLKNSELTFREIAETMGLSESTVKKINYGKLRKGLSENYPIRTLTPQKRKVLEVKDFLLNTEFKPMEIARMVDVSLETIRRINLGITNKDEKLDYPLRNL